MEASSSSPAPELEGVLSSRASELTGRAQTSRNELFALFGVWVGFSDGAMGKEAAEAQDRLLREEQPVPAGCSARSSRYLQALAGSGARVEYSGNASRTVSVSWRGLTAERQVCDGRSAARNAFVDTLRKFLASSGVRQWPVPARPALAPGRVKDITMPGGARADPGSVLVGGHRQGQPFSSTFATRHVDRGEVGLVVEQVRVSTGLAPFLTTILRTQAACS
jgi:hypothetical protein